MKRSRYATINEPCQNVSLKGIVQGGKTSIPFIIYQEINWSISQGRIRLWEKVNWFCQNKLGGNRVLTK